MADSQHVGRYRDHGAMGHLVAQGQPRDAHEQAPDRLHGTVRPRVRQGSGHLWLVCGGAALAQGEHGARGASGSGQAHQEGQSQNECCGQLAHVRAFR